MTKKLLLSAFAAAAILASAGIAQAQSGCQYIVYGATLTVAQWNSCFAAKNNTLGFTPVNKAGDTMLGKFTTIASTTIAAGFNIPHGAAPSAPVNGDLWTTTSGVFVRINGATSQLLTSGGVITSPVAVNLNSASLQAAQVGTLFQGQQADGVVARSELDSFGAISSFSGIVAGGTKASPTAVTSGTQLTGINAFAYNGASFVGPIVSFRTYAAENVASGHQGSKACMSTTAIAGTTLTDHLCQNASGGIVIGSPTGSDEGADTFNSAGNIFQNGVQVATLTNSVSLSNKTIVSPTFSGTVAGANTVPLSVLAQSAANTMLGNWTGSTANAVANAMPSCSDTGGNHLNYVSGTGITCGSTSVTGSFVQNYITGLTLSTAGSSTTFTTAAGMASDSTNAQQMVLASSLAKTTGSWVVGAAAGCLDTGSVAINTWYTIYEIERTDLSVVDVLCSTNATTPTMPLNYTFKRRIGAMRTNGSSQWSLFTQVGGFVNYGAEFNDNLNTNCVASNVAYTLTVPTGVSVSPILSLRVDLSGATTNFTIGSGGTSATLTVASGSAGTVIAPISNAIVTNASGQIAINANSTNCQFTTFVLGYYDFRGQQ